MHQLTGFQRDLLYVTAGLEEPHGFEIKRAVKEYYETEIVHGRTYPDLDSLVEDGLVEKRQHDGRTNIYQVTERALDELKARREWEDQYLEGEGST